MSDDQANRLVAQLHAEYVEWCRSPFTARMMEYAASRSAFIADMVLKPGHSTVDPVYKEALNAERERLLSIINGDFASNVYGFHRKRIFDAVRIQQQLADAPAQAVRREGGSSGATREPPVLAGLGYIPSDDDE